MDTRRRFQIFQTCTVRLKEGMSGPPDSYTDEEKEYYIETEKCILEDRANGFSGTYIFPNDYD